MPGWNRTPERSFDEVHLAEHGAVDGCAGCRQALTAREWGLNYVSHGIPRKETYQAWTAAVRSHQWRLGRAACHSCKGTSQPTISAEGISLCAGPRCLGQSLIWWWPTGDWRPMTDGLLRHALTCTSH